MKNIKKELIEQKLNLVVEKLMNLGGPENEDELKDGGEAIGFFKRDFGIAEWDWPQGVGLYGLLKMMKIQGNDDYKTFLHQWFKGNIADGLPSRNINTTTPLLTLAELNEEYQDKEFEALCLETFLHQWFKGNIADGLPSRNINTTTPLLTLAELNEEYQDKEFEALCLDWADWLMNCIPRTKEGGFQHVTSANGDRQGVRLNESEMWIDTLFMTVLFLNKMGQKYQKQEWIDESIHQVLMHIKYLYDTHTGLFYHGWSFNRMDNFGGIFWCRGNSWFTLGILDYVEMFKGTLNAGVKAIILDTYKAQVRKLKELQSKSGLWHTVLTDSDSYEEVSGSAAIVAGILKGIKMGILDDSYLECAWKGVQAILKNIDKDGTYEEVSGSAAIVAGILKGIKMGILDDSYLECAWKGVQAILKNIDKDGTVLNVSGGTGMGYDADHYKNILIAPMAYGQSLTILALVEALNIDKDGTVLNVSGGTGMGYDADHYKNILIAPMAYGQSLTILALVEALQLAE